MDSANANTHTNYNEVRFTSGLSVSLPLVETSPFDRDNLTQAIFCFLSRGNELPCSWLQLGLELVYTYS